ncbi:MAG: hypothetical protein IH861_09510 [Chloroflexi bacterium]|nr:hypothetical protein [Chloroflexota bacterium]
MKQRHLYLLVAGILAIAAIATSLNASVVSALQTDIVSHYVAEALPLADPGSPMWNQATSMDVPLSGQVTIAPKNALPSVTSMRVRSLNNGSWVAFLLEWDDPTKDVGGSLTSFKDSAAIQFPSEEGQPFICMGVGRSRVQILHWRADFQQDIESGLPNASEIYPNMWVNIYPGGDDTVFSTGLSAGNPLSAADKTSPVEDLLAGGFGTLTSEIHNDAVGWANWSDGSWKAVIARPMTTIDVDDAQFAGGMETSLALAAWDGGQGEINGKKSVSTWVSLRIEAPPSAIGVPVTLPAASAPATRQEIIVRRDLPVGTMIIIGVLFAATLVFASWMSWVMARRS